MNNPLMIGDIVEDHEGQQLIIRLLHEDGTVQLSTLDTGVVVQRRLEELTFVSEWDESAVVDE